MGFDATMARADFMPSQPLRWHAAAGPPLSQSGHAISPIGRSDVSLVSDGLAYWDAWPLLGNDGALYRNSVGAELWFALAAPFFADPDVRHGHARIHGLRRTGDRFEPLGPVLRDGLSPGSREWSGSATIDPATRLVTLRFTAAGLRGETARTYHQRIFATQASLGEDLLPTDWTVPREILLAGGLDYRPANQAGGEIGKIKAFRDPEFFRDPTGSGDFLTFTASSARNPGDYDGLIGLARLGSDGTAIPLAPLIDASGFNNELERPHIRFFDGRYYLFWSTQSHVFAPAAGAWPTGLYGAVADAITGPWEMLNATGLVAANPASARNQSYSWLVLPDRSVTSFADRLADRVGNPVFAGGFAPFFDLIVDGVTVTIGNR